MKQERRTIYKIQIIINLSIIDKHHSIRWPCRSAAAAVVAVILEEEAEEEEKVEKKEEKEKEQKKGQDFILLCVCQRFI